MSPKSPYHLPLSIPAANLAHLPKPPFWLVAGAGTALLLAFLVQHPVLLIAGLAATITMAHRLAQQGVDPSYPVRPGTDGGTFRGECHSDRSTPPVNPIVLDGGSLEHHGADTARADSARPAATRR